MMVWLKGFEAEVVARLLAASVMMPHVCWNGELRNGLLTFTALDWTL